MGQRKLVLVSSRFDHEHEPWAREPTLTPVVELRGISQRAGGAIWR